jgi:outer membrane protein assembly factor BamB
LTNGLSSFAVKGGCAFTQVRREFPAGEKEVCIALSITNGMELWATPVEDNTQYDGGVGDTDDGPRTTPAVDGDSVYVLSSYLNLYRLNATNGVVIWHKDLHAIYGSQFIGWQNAASPRIEDGLIFINANCSTSSLMALRTSDGEPAWRSQNERMTHSTPVLTTMHGVRQLIFAAQSGLVSLNPQTGARLWKHNYPFGYNTSLATSPAVCEDMVFITAYYGMGSAVVRIVNSNSTLVTTQLWRNTSLQSHWSTPVCHQGFLYGQFTPDWWDAQLRCINMTNGTLMWATNGFGRGSVLLIDGHLLAITERGQLVLARATPTAYTEVARFLAIPNYADNMNKCWNSLAVSDGRVYVRSTAYAAVFDFSVPPLKLDPPLFTPANRFELTVRTADGTPLDSNRLAGLGVRASADVNLLPSMWTPVTNPLIFSGGVVRITNLDANAPQQFFIVTEPK